MKIKFLKLLLLSFLISTTSCSTSVEDILVEDEISENVEEETQEEEEEEEENENSQETSEEENSNGEENTTSTSFVADHGQLRVRGAKIVDKNGETVQLRGMSFFWSQWMGKYYNAEIVKWLKDDWQCNIVRVAMGVDEGGEAYIANPEIEKQKAYAVIDAAIAEGIYVIIDWHTHHGEDYITEAKIFFDEVSKKYGDTPNIIYETYNEPLDVSWETVLKPYHEEVIATIRNNDADNLIICGTRTWSQRVDEVIGKTIDDTNIAYTLHYYSATHDQDLRDIAQKAIDNDIAIFVTEYGITEADGGGTFNSDESQKWWDFLDENSIGWCNWSIADKEELSAALKPGASTAGEWSENDLTASGAIIRAEIKAKNPNYTN